MFPTNFREITLQSYLQSDQVCQTSVEKTLIHLMRKLWQLNEMALEFNNHVIS